MHTIFRTRNTHGVNQTNVFTAMLKQKNKEKLPKKL